MYIYIYYIFQKYNIRWYIASLYAYKMIFILQKSSQPFHINITELFLKNFAIVKIRRYSKLKYQNLDKKYFLFFKKIICEIIKCVRVPL